MPAAYFIVYICKDVWEGTFLVFAADRPTQTLLKYFYYHNTFTCTISCIQRTILEPPHIPLPTKDNTLNRFMYLAFLCRLRQRRCLWD